MESTKAKQIRIETTVNAPVEKVWEVWTNPGHITKWNNASDEWHTPRAQNDLRTGGAFLYRMKARDGSFGFDFKGVYDEVEANRIIRYTMDDGRKASVEFMPAGNGTKVTETFEAESANPEEMQRQGWQNILDSFRKYTEALI